MLNRVHRQPELWKWKFNCSSANVNIKYCIKGIKRKKTLKNTLILKIKMQLLCILSKSHFQLGIKWKDYALQHLEQSICIFGPIDYRLLKTDRNLKQLSVYRLSIFLIHFILQRPTLTASTSLQMEANGIQHQSAHGSGTHQELHGQVVLPDTNYVHTTGVHLLC